MFQRLTDIMKNRIDRFLSQELSPEEIEEMHLNEGLGLEDVEGESLADMVEMFAQQDGDTFNIDVDNAFFDRNDISYFNLRAFDFDFRNPWNDD
jgi:hypothetical protein